MKLTYKPTDYYFRTTSDGTVFLPKNETTNRYARVIDILEQSNKKLEMNMYIITTVYNEVKKVSTKSIVDIINGKIETSHQYQQATNIPITLFTFRYVRLPVGYLKG